MQLRILLIYSNYKIIHANKNLKEIKSLKSKQEFDYQFLTKSTEYYVIQ